MTECLTCSYTADPAAPRYERIVVTDHWRVAHAFNTSLPGWLVAIPLRHVTDLAELDPVAAAELGPLLSDLTAALKEITGCTKTYVALYAENPGFSHVHFHVVPRSPTLAPEYRGPGVFAFLGRPREDRVPESEMHRISEAVAHHLGTG